MINILTIASLTLAILGLLYKGLYWAISRTFIDELYLKFMCKEQCKANHEINDVVVRNIEATLREIKQDLKDIKAEMHKIV